MQRKEASAGNRFFVIQVLQRCDFRGDLLAACVMLESLIERFLRTIQRILNTMACLSKEDWKAVNLKNPFTQNFHKWKDMEKCGVNKSESLFYEDDDDDDVLEREALRSKVSKPRGPTKVPRPDPVFCFSITCTRVS